jgi:6-phosphogluconolactonase (cycloisomerase 2 family)
MTRSAPFRTTAAVALSVASLAPSAVRAQDNACNVPAKDAIVNLDTPGKPFEPVITPDGCWIFVTLTQGASSGGGGIAVVQRANGSLSIARTVPLQDAPTGAVLTHDGKLLVVADGGYLAFLDVARLESGDGDPVLGYMGNGAPVGFIYANVTADDRYVIASAERAAAVILIDLDSARAGGFRERGIAAKLDVGNAPISVTLSPDGRTLYTTSEVASAAWNWPRSCRPENRNVRPNAPFHPPGAIIAFDVAAALRDPSRAEITRVAAGCNPVRLVLSPDGSVAYVSARDDNTLLAFDTKRLVSDSAHALLGRTEVGVAPVGIAVVDSGHRVVVTSSNRFGGGTGDHQPLTVVDAMRLRGGQPAVTGTIKAGAFPRELRLSADGRTLFVTNFGSSTLEMIDLARAVTPSR